MKDLTKNEAAFLEKIKNENIDLSKLTKRLKLLIKFCQISAAIMIPITLFVVFVIGETPKIFHLLAFLSICFVVLSQYINWKKTLKFIEKLKENEK